MLVNLPAAAPPRHVLLPTPSQPPGLDILTASVDVRRATRVGSVSVPSYPVTNMVVKLSRDRQVVSVNVSRIIRVLSATLTHKHRALLPQFYRLPLTPLHTQQPCQLMRHHHQLCPHPRPLQPPLHRPPRYLSHKRLPIRPLQRMLQPRLNHQRHQLQFQLHRRAPQLHLTLNRTQCHQRRPYLRR